MDKILGDVKLIPTLHYFTINVLDVNMSNSREKGRSYILKIETVLRGEYLSILAHEESQ